LEPQRFGFVGRQLKHEVAGEAVSIAADGSVEIFRENLVQIGQISIEHNLLPADEVDLALDKFRRHRRRVNEGCGSLRHLANTLLNTQLNTRWNLSNKSRAPGRKIRELRTLPAAISS
jgi:hypothetical protein